MKINTKEAAKHRDHADRRVKKADSLSNRSYLKNNLLAASITASLLAPLNNAVAAEFSAGDWSGSLDTTISYGAIYRMQAQDEDLIAEVNGGGPGNDSIVIDDGNANFRKGELVSEVLKVVPEFSLQKDNYGLFLRGRAFYDFELEDDNRRHREISEDGLDAAGSGAELLDAFIYSTWDIGQRTASVRLGRQVINWGEALYTQNGIAATNPYDVSALRAPGSELKEAFLPTTMAFGSLVVNQNATIEGYWQPGSAWRHTEIDPCGTYFSTNDIVGDDDCNYLPIASLQESITGALTGSPTAFDKPGDVESADGLPPAAAGLLASTFVPRTDDREPDGPQYGLAFRLLAPDLNYTEFGLYYLRYSTQTPVISTRAAGLNATPIGPIPDASSAEYFAEYFDDLDLYGASFNTTIVDGVLSGMTLAGELSYRPDAIISKYTPAVIEQAIIGGLPEGTYIPGYIERDRAQASISTLYSLPRGLLGADSGLLANEIVFNRIMGSFESSEFDDPRRDGGFTNSSWGTTLVSSLTYETSEFTVTPSVSVYAAINGRNGANNEGERAYTAKISAIHRSNLGAEVSYVTYNGDGRIDRDRDFLSFNVKYSF